MNTIKLFTGEAVVVDDEWYPILSQHRWHLTCKGYAARCPVPGKSIFMHRVINGTPDGFETDHINGNKLDNRAANLRTVTTQQNAWNRPRKAGASGYRGVTIRPDTGRYQASIGSNYKRMYLGVFDTAEEAYAVYAAKAKELYGEYACIQ